MSPQRYDYNKMDYFLHISILTSYVIWYQYKVSLNIFRSLNCTEYVAGSGRDRIYLVHVGSDVY